MNFVSCKECIFYRSTSMYIGQCYRFPPTVYIHNSGIFSNYPEVKLETGGCGEGFTGQVDSENILSPSILDYCILFIKKYFINKNVLKFN